MTSRSVTMYPVVSALSRADDILGKGTAWVPANLRQARFQESCFTPSVRAEAERLEAEGVMESLASHDVSVLNALLERRNFDIRLDPLGPEGFGTVGILDMTDEWRVPGEEEPITTKDGDTYVGALMEHGAVFSESPHAVDADIATISTKTGILVHMMMPNDPLPMDDLQLQTYLQSVSASRTETRRYAELLFPYIDLDHEPDISWLREMIAAPANPLPPYEIEQAMQQTKLKMNCTGFRVRSAAAFGFECLGVAMEKPRLTIDRPFLCWIERPDLTLPIASFYLDYECWNDPEGLGE